MSEHNNAPMGHPICYMCRRERTPADPAHPMDAYGYSPIQVITGQPLGWYSGDDGEVCPECMTKTLRNQDGWTPATPVRATGDVA